ncbi:MAG: gliding motility-associated ABC transporter substrate-binding protein GldG [Pedobacter sp.]|nr:MAG: gliding motility-associated ABC transporter substrate-binding protein GldG [Pedobacter sp.]
MVNKIKILSFWPFILLLLGLIFFEYYPLRFDFTQDKRFSLRKETLALLDSLEKPLHITVYLDGDMHPSFKRLQQATEALLIDYRQVANKTIQISFVDPLAGMNLEKQSEVIQNLGTVGIRPIQIYFTRDEGVTQKLIFPMALIDDGESLIPVNLLSKISGSATRYEENINSSIAQLEYSFSSRIQALKNRELPRIGFTEGHGEPDNRYLLDAFRSLSESYLVGRVDLQKIQKSGLDSLKVLVIAQPKNAFSELEKYKLDYFIQQGGRVIWALDKVQISLADLQSGDYKLAQPSDLNLDDMLFEFGIRIPANLVSDLNAAPIPITSGELGQNSIQLLPWVYFPIGIPDISHKISYKIDPLKLQFASTIDTLQTTGIKKSVILKTSGRTKVMPAPFPLSLQLIGKKIASEEYQAGEQTLGVLLEGNFKSSFFFRGAPEGIMETFPKRDISVFNKMIVISDGDVFTNDLDEEEENPKTLGYDSFSDTQYGNKAFLLNAIDYLALDRPLLELRNREVQLRLIDKVKAKSSKWIWQFWGFGLPLIMLITLVIFQHYYRMYRYAK